VWGVRLLNKKKGLSIGGVKFDVPPRYTTKAAAKVEMAGGGQEEEEGDVKMNKEKEAEEDHEDNGDYEAESSPARRGVKGKKGKGNRKVGRPKKVKVKPPPPATATPTTTTVPPVNAVFGEVKINETIVPLCPPISASKEADDGSDEEEDGDGESLTDGKENGVGCGRIAGIERFGD